MKSRRELLIGAAGLGALLTATSAQARTLSVTVSPTYLEGVGFDLTDDATATVSGGVPPYSYEWVQVSGSSYIEVNDPNGAFTNFYWNGPWGGPVKLSGWRCQVTDATNATATSNLLTVSFDPTR